MVSLLLALSPLLLRASPSPPAKLKPNIFIVLAVTHRHPTPPHLLLPALTAHWRQDDFGWHNIGWRNKEIRSPHLDALAADGIKLDRHCALSPSQ